MTTLMPGWSRPVGTEARAVKEYRYALARQPLTSETAPGDYLRLEPRPAATAPFYACARYGVLVYGRALTDKETRRYELPRLLDAEDETALLQDLVKAFRRDAGGLLMLARADPHWFAIVMANAVDRHGPGFVPMVGDPRQFRQRLLVALLNVHRGAHG